MSILVSGPKDLYFPIAIISKHCVIFLAMDARTMSADEIGNIASRAFAQGAVYLCVWGPDCERVHDIMDEVVADRNFNETDEDVVMTTWHDDETLEEALWFAVNSAFAVGAYEQTCKTLVAVTIENQDWGSQIAKKLSESVG